MAFFPPIGQSVIVWKEPTRIISAGQRMIRKDSRMKLIPTPTGGMGLRIERVTPDDRGKGYFVVKIKIIYLSATFLHRD